MTREIGYQTYRLDDEQRKQLDRAATYFNGAQKILSLANRGHCQLPTTRGYIDVDRFGNARGDGGESIAVTGLPFSDNWFTHSFEGRGLMTIAGWEVAFIDKGKDAINAAPDAHILTSLAFASLLALGGLTDREFLHETSIGCLFDFCEQKRERILKMRAAYVCPSCTAKLARSGVSSIEIDAIHSVLDCVRRLVLGRQPQLQMPNLPDDEVFINGVKDLNRFSLPPALVEACQKGELTVLVGSGLSLQEDVDVAYDPSLKWKRLPAWSDLPVRMSDCLERYKGRKRKPDETETLEEFLADLDRYRASLGEATYYPRAIFDVFTPQVRSVGLANRLLFRLPLKSILTTNYDFVLQCAAPTGAPVFTWKEARSAREYLELGRGQKPILKLHGCASRPDTVVMTMVEYERLKQNAEYLSLLASLFQHHTMLFLGFGFNDPRDLDHILSEAELAGAAGGQKFAILPEQQCRTVQEKFRQIQTVPYRSHSELSSVIAAFVVAAKLRGNNLP